VRLITVPAMKTRFDAEFYLHKVDEFQFINFPKYAEHEKHRHNLESLLINS
jgi:hypothetical protein